MFVPAQPLVVPFTVYVIVAVGLATGFEIAGLLKLVAGVHAYEAAPLAVSVVLPPLQMVVLAGEIETVGVGFTVTEKVVCAVHPALDAVIV